VVTQRDIAETVQGLRQEARGLRSAALTRPIPDMAEPVVVVKVAGLIATAEYLEAVAAELLTLIDDRKPIKVKPNSEA
jgi:hypothetical protein